MSWRFTEFGITGVATMGTPKGFQAPKRVECGTEEIAKVARKTWPNAEVVINDALGSWGWMAIADKLPGGET